MSTSVIKALQEEINEENGKKRMTKEFLKKLLRSDIKLYYTTPYLNDILYLHYKGLDEIENLEEFTGLKCLYMEGNGKVFEFSDSLRILPICEKGWKISDKIILEFAPYSLGFTKLQGLEKQEDLRCLYIHENLIKKIENIDHLKKLVSLNLTDNFIEKIENLENNPELETLTIKRNQVGINGIADIEGLAKLKQLKVLDISHNKIDLEDSELFIEILRQMDSLSVLYMMHNKIVSKIPNYRKTLTNALPNLKYLDDRPIFPEDRRYAAAFLRGGLAEEREERQRVKEEKEAERMKQHEDFKAMLNEFREKRAADKAAEESDSDSQVDSKNLDTYYTQTESLDKSQDSGTKPSTLKSESVDAENNQDQNDAEEDSISQSSENSDKKGSVKSESDTRQAQNDTRNSTIKNLGQDVIFSDYLTELD